MLLILTQRGVKSVLISAEQAFNPKGTQKKPQPQTAAEARLQHNKKHIPRGRRGQRHTDSKELSPRDGCLFSKYWLNSLIMSE